MAQDGILAKPKLWLWLPLALYSVVCFVIPSIFFSSWPMWALEVFGMLSVGGERLLRALARSVYRKLKAILPEHEKEIQAYQDGLHVFRRNIMVEPDFVEPLAANYPEKNKLMVELRLLYKISHIWNTVGSILFVLAFACLLYLLIS